MKRISIKNCSSEISQNKRETNSFTDKQNEIAHIPIYYNKCFKIWMGNNNNIYHYWLNLRRKCIWILKFIMFCQFSEPKSELREKEEGIHSFFQTSVLVSFRYFFGFQISKPCKKHYNFHLKVAPSIIVAAEKRMNRTERILCIWNYMNWLCSASVTIFCTLFFPYHRFFIDSLLEDFCMFVGLLFSK